MITATSNNQIKNLIQLQTKASARNRQKLFVVEGIKIVLETPDELLQDIYISEEIINDSNIMKRIEDKLKKAECHGCKNLITVSSKVFKTVSDTVTPQGVMAVVKQKHDSLESILSVNNKEKTIMILDNLRDPGNMGTIIRTGEGAGITGILMNSGCVDIYNPKVTRSTMGSIFRVPICISQNLTEDIDKLKQKGFKIFAGHLKGEDYDKHPHFFGNIGIVIGNEANGISDEVSQMADELIRIPMSGKVESLNASVAAAILMYEARSRKNT